MKIVLLGAPGAGKGTQAFEISKKYGLPHISTGDIFRKNIKEKTPIGLVAKGYIDKGQLVPDEVTVEIVRQRLAEPDCEKGFLLDGFPRNTFQAQELDKIAGVDVAIDVAVPFERLLKRITGRRVCSVCGESFHVDNIGDEKKCRVCGGELIQRADDNEKTVNERIKVYSEQTAPLIEYYRNKKVLKTVDGDKPVAAVTESIFGVLDDLR